MRLISLLLLLALARYAAAAFCVFCACVLLRQRRRRAAHQDDDLSDHRRFGLHARHHRGPLWPRGRCRQPAGLAGACHALVPCTPRAAVALSVCFSSRFRASLRPRSCRRPGGVRCLVAAVGLADCVGARPRVQRHVPDVHPPAHVPSRPGACVGLLRPALNVALQEWSKL